MTDVVERYCDSCGVFGNLSDAWYTNVCMRNGVFSRHHFCTSCSKVAKQQFGKIGQAPTKPEVEKDEGWLG